MKPVKALFIARLEQLPEPEQLERYSRLYFGNEFCEYLLPSRRAVKQALDTGLDLSLVLPILTDGSLEQVDRLLDLLGDDGRSHEVVANDFGVLEMLRTRPGLVAVAGRLVSRNIFDIGDREVRSMNPAPLALLQSQYKVTRFEISSYHSKLRAPESGIPEGVRLSMYYPYMYLATTRQCVFRFQDVPRLAKRSGQPVLRYRDVDHLADISALGCDRGCRKHLFRLRYPGYSDSPFFLKGNTMFTCFDEFPYSNRELATLQIDRVVRSPDIPM